VKINKPIKILVLCLISLFLIALFLEAISFIFVKSYNFIKKRDYSPDNKIEYVNWWDFSPVFGIRPKPNLPFIYDGTGLFLGTDNYGFVHNGDAARKLLPKPTNTYRIFVLGGSTVAGRGVSYNKDTIPAQMEKMLKENPDYNFNIEVINAGVRGWLSFGELCYLAKELLYFYPDLIVVLDGINDFYYLHFGGNNLPNLSNEQISIMRIWNNQGIPAFRYHLKAAIFSICPSFTSFCKKIYNQVRGRSYFMLLINSLNKNLNFDNITASRYTGGLTDVPVVNPSSYNSYIQNLKNIIGICRVNNIGCIILFQPTLGSGRKQLLSAEEKRLLGQIDADMRVGNAAALLTEYYRIVTKEFQALKAAYQDDHIWIDDLSYVFDGIGANVYYDQVHYNAEGSRILAKRINSIIESNFLKKNKDEQRLIQFN